jgi:hypothetical protein
LWRHFPLEEHSKKGHGKEGLGGDGGEGGEGEAEDEEQEQVGEGPRFRVHDSGLRV